MYPASLGCSLRTLVNPATSFESCALDHTRRHLHHMPSIVARAYEKNRLEQIGPHFRIAELVEETPCNVGDRVRVAERPSLRLRVTPEASYQSSSQSARAFSHFGEQLCWHLHQSRVHKLVLAANLFERGGEPCHVLVGPRICGAQLFEQIVQRIGLNDPEDDAHRAVEILKHLLD